MRLKKLSLFLLGLGSALSASSQEGVDYDLLVGSYTQGASKGVYLYKFDSQTGKIDSIPRQVIETINPAWLTLSKSQRYVFVVNENSPGQRDPVGRVSSFSIDEKTHFLTLINQVESQGEEPTHSNLSIDEKFLFVANYDVQTPAGGSLVALPVDSSGKLSSVVQTSRHTASNVNIKRQRSSHVHSAVLTPDGKFLAASDLGADKIFVYRYLGDPTQPFEAENTSSVDLPPGSGPRHLLFSHDSKHAYLTLEMAGQVASFDYKNGRFKQTQLLNVFDSSGAEENGVGGLHSSSDGKFLYVANRGNVNKIYVFSIDELTGALKEIQHRSVEGIEPREFSLDPTGGFLLVANQKTNQIVVIRRDVANGLLLDTVQVLTFDSPSDLKFITR